MEITYQEYRFPGHPSYRKWHATIDFVIVGGIKLVVSSKVGDFYVVRFAYQTIPEDIRKSHFEVPVSQNFLHR